MYAVSALMPSFPFQSLTEPARRIILKVINGEFSLRISVTFRAVFAVDIVVMARSNMQSGKAVVKIFILVRSFLGQHNDGAIVRAEVFVRNHHEVLRSDLVVQRVDAIHRLGIARH